MGFSRVNEFNAILSCAGMLGESYSRRGVNCEKLQSNAPQKRAVLHQAHSDDEQAGPRFGASPTKRCHQSRSAESIPTRVPDHRRNFAGVVNPTTVGPQIVPQN